MKISYDIIKKNIETYEEAKKLFPAIGQWERGEIGISAMSSLSLSAFASFWDFLKSVRSAGYEPVMEVDWKWLKKEIVDKTDTPRFKKFIGNRTRAQFEELLADGDKFDRLFNGAWLRRPRILRNGRQGYGQRKAERVEGLNSARIPIINYIISNQVEIFKDFDSVEGLSESMQWFFWKKLSLDTVPRREIEFTNKLLVVIYGVMEKERVDFRKLNMDYVVSALEARIKSQMMVEEGTMLKCIDGKVDYAGKPELIKDRFYRVHSCATRNGNLVVSVTNEQGHKVNYRFEHFEDMGRHRDDLIESLFDV